MDNKIIIELIKKNIEELKLIAEAFEDKQNSLPILIDIATSKTQSLLHMISLMNSEEREIQPIQFESEQSTNQNLEKTDSLLDHAVEQTEVKEVVVTETITTQENNIEEPIIHEVTYVEKKAEVEEDAEQAHINQENSTKKSHIVLGEKFTKEPTINERFTSNPENQYKIKGKPVTSIKGAIGLNDRFMYTRELFENDKNKFEITIDILDKAFGLHEAIEYLEQNFKWQKNDTSLKFMKLVKRRFED